MPQITRSSDVVESHSEKVVGYGIAGLALIGLALLIFKFHSGGMFLPFAIVLAAIGAILVVTSLYWATKIRSVTSFDITCSYCNATNRLTEPPEDDVACIDCHRLIPIKNGKALPVMEVRCGFCNTLNYYSEKTDVLLCESCNHDIPISHDEGHVTKKQTSVFAVQEDTRTYDLVLVTHGAKTEELISTLQHMLALNRNQVKDILEDLPSTLLTGIPKKKAEMLRAQLAVHDALAECKPNQAQQP